MGLRVTKGKKRERKREDMIVLKGPGCVECVCGIDGGIGVLIIMTPFSCV